MDSDIRQQAKQAAAIARLRAEQLMIKYGIARTNDDEFKPEVETEEKEEKKEEENKGEEEKEEEEEKKEETEQVVQEMMNTENVVNYADVADLPMTIVKPSIFICSIYYI